MAPPFVRVYHAGLDKTIETSQKSLPARLAKGWKLVGASDSVEHTVIDVNVPEGTFTPNSEDN